VPAVKLFGDDYDTPDGTCIRDYIHVMDLCAAHLRALEFMQRGARGFNAFNLGNGNGYSVKQVVACVEKVIGATLPVERGPRRAGDPAVLVASSVRAQRELQWTPQMPQLEAMIETAWRWHRAPRF
jgi:UDP-glucose 4-epimerase